jgi:diacylglycerol kinase family enzyme
LTILIYNPRSGRLVRDPSLAARIASTLERHKPRLQQKATEGPGHATLLARDAVRDGASMIIVLAGDGTINEVVNGMAGSETRLAIVPAGTANVLACELRLNRKPEAVASRIPSLRPARIALGRVRTSDGGSRYFLSLAGAGMDAAVIERVRPALKDRLGRLAYWWAGLSMLGLPLGQFDVLVDGHRERTGFALASRVRNFGGDLRIATRASLFADQLEVVTFAGSSTIPYAFYLLGAAAGLATRLPGVRSVLTQSVELLPIDDKPVYMQIDGELSGSLPARVDVVPGSLTLLVP